MDVIITAPQCRAARAYLGWSQEELARRAGVHKNTIADLENDRHLKSLRTLRLIRYALEAGGLRLLENGGIVPFSERT